MNLIEQSQFLVSLVGNLSVFSLLLCNLLSIFTLVYNRQIEQTILFLQRTLENVLVCEQNADVDILVKMAMIKAIDNLFKIIKTSLKQILN